MGGFQNNDRRTISYRISPGIAATLFHSCPIGFFSGTLFPVYQNSPHFQEGDCMKRWSAVLCYIIIAALLALVLCTGPVSAVSKPKADFSGTPRSGTAPLTVTFTDESTKTPTSWNWSFGDGSYSELQDPDHTYTSAATYIVILKATNAVGSDTETKTGYITVTPLPTVTSITPATGVNTTTISITNLSGTNFADGATVMLNRTGSEDIAGTSVSVVSSTRIACKFNLAHKTAGRYNVVVTNSDGHGAVLANAFTVTIPPPDAAFSGTPLSGTAPFTVTFTDKSTHAPASWNWSFGDGNYSELQNPTHTYEFTGTFSVALNATNDGGSDTKTMNRYISAAATSKNANMTINGTTIHTHDGRQNVIVNLSDVNGTVTQPDARTVIVHNPGSGWGRMKLVSGNTVTNETGDLNVSEISQVVMTTSPVSTALNNVALGTVMSQISIPMTQMPTGVAIEQNIYEGANESALSAFQLAATDNNLTINNVAYTVEIKNTASLNANLTGASDPVRLNLSISNAWVVANGGTANIRIFRSAEDGTKQVLMTRFLFNDTATDTDFFEGESPNGLSIFAIISVSNTATSSTSYSLSTSSVSTSDPESSQQSTAVPVPPDPSGGPWTTLRMTGQTHISQISVQTKRTLKDLFIISEKMDTMPGEIVKPDAPVYEYHKIELYRAMDDDINQATIEFIVNENWLNQQKMTIHDVQLLRYHEGRWENLPTEYIGTLNGQYIFRATTGGFSYYATVLIKDATIMHETPATPESPTALTSTITVKGTLPSPVSLAAAEQIAENIPEQEEGSPLFPVVIGLGGIVILAASGFIVRAWWIRRQNPALFRDEPFIRLRRGDR